MKAKKNDSVNLEKNKFTYLLVGLALTLGLVYGAMEWTSASSNVRILEASNLFVDDEYIAINTVQKPPPPPPPPVKPKIAEILEIIDSDDPEEPDEIMFVEEVDGNTTIDIVEIDEPEEELFKEPFRIVEKMPTFPGGNLALMKQIAKEVKYPALARDNCIQGRVFVRFVITENGEVDRVSVIRSVDALLDKEAMRAVKKLTGWIPGTQRGKPVPVWYTLPINFRLN